MKGRKVPIDQRGQYVKNQRMMEAQAEIMKNKPKDVPIFKVYNDFLLIPITSFIILFTYINYPFESFKYSRYLYDLLLVVYGFLAVILLEIKERLH